MPTPTVLRNLISTDRELVARSADLNEMDFLHRIASGRTPVARYVGNGDIANPPAPAWYLPSTGDIYIHVDRAEVGRPPVIDSTSIHRATLPAKAARILGLLAHEAAHAAISDPMDKVIRKAPHHAGLLTMLDELRVENYAIRATPIARTFLRASFGLVLANMPDTFENASHVVRAWALARGRTLAGVAAPDETDAVDVAARTLLGDDVIDSLTDLLQEALTVMLGGSHGEDRMIRICDEWHALIGDPPEDTTGCTSCVRAPFPGETFPSDSKSEPGDGDGGKGDDDDDDGDKGKGKGHDGGDTGSSWGIAGQDDPDDDSDDDHIGDGLLSDEDGELMRMVQRDLQELMQDEWQRPLDAVKVSNSAEWAAKVFGNRRNSTRLSASAPSATARQHVVQVAAELSNLSLPAIAKKARPQQAPPGRMRSREALRASAERAQGKMMTAKPWKATVRRHTSARPLVIGIATDTSGSMRWAESAVAEFAYVYANAGHRIGARTAAVTFGDHVHRIARPGEVLDKVMTKAASDGTEEFDQAMAALDGVLHLTTPGTSARILIVVSDGQLVKANEPDRALMWCKAMDKAGTRIIWITDQVRAGGGYGAEWLRQAANLPNFSVQGAVDPVKVRGAAHGPATVGRSVFDRLNDAALTAIRAS